MLRKIIDVVNGKFENLKKKEKLMIFREEKRRLKRLERKRQHEEKTLAMKIALEERKMLIAHRKLQSMRLLEELFNRVKVRASLSLHFSPLSSSSGSNRSRRADEKRT